MNWKACVLGVIGLLGVACWGENETWIATETVDSENRTWTVFTFKGNGQERARCRHEGDGSTDFDFCRARESEMVNDCVMGEDVIWCKNEPAPVTVQVVNY